MAMSSGQIWATGHCFDLNKFIKTYMYFDSMDFHSYIWSTASSEFSAVMISAAQWLRDYHCLLTAKAFPHNTLTVCEVYCMF